MFDDILGKREETPKQVLGTGIASPTSVGGVDSPDGMDPKKKPAIPTPLGKQPEPEDDLWGVDDCDCDEDGNVCNDCDCDGGC